MSSAFGGPEFDAEVRTAADQRRASKEATKRSAENEREAALADAAAIRAAGVDAATELRRRGVWTKPSKVETTGGHQRRGIFESKWVLDNAALPIIRRSEYPERWEVSLPGIIHLSEYGDYVESVTLTVDGRIGTVCPVFDARTGQIRPSEPLDNRITLARAVFQELCLQQMANGEWWVTRQGPYNTLAQVGRFLASFRQGVIAVAAAGR
jgi:hypothetical protein